MDVLHDESWRQWLKIAGTYKIPQYVLRHTPMEKEAAEQLDDALFADPVNRAFPIDGAASTWLSAAYFNENRGKIDAVLGEHILGTIKLAAGVYNIDRDVKEALERRDAEVADPEGNPENYGYTAPDGTKMFPMFDRDGVEKAAEYFNNFRGSFPAPVRRQVALSIVKHAGAYGVAVHESVFREAGLGIPNRADIIDNLLDRGAMTKDAECAAVVGALTQLIMEAGPDELYENLDKLASAIGSLDELNGMAGQYGKKLLAPADFIYSMSVKDAADSADDALTLHRHTFSIRKLAELNPEVFRTALGEDLFKSISDPSGKKLDRVKMAEVLPTLPRPDRVVLEDYIASCCA